MNIINNGNKIFKNETKNNKFPDKILPKKIAIKVLKSISFARKNGICINLNKIKVTIKVSIILIIFSETKRFNFE